MCDTPSQAARSPKEIQIEIAKNEPSINWEKKGRDDSEREGRKCPECRTK